MANTLFTNVRIIDGSGAPPYAGEVLVQGNRISRVTRGGRPAPVAGATVIDARRRHADARHDRGPHHFSWNNAATLRRHPAHAARGAHAAGPPAVARLYLDSGWTSCVGAATAKPRLDVVIRNAINEGLMPGPRYLAASQEITVAGSLGDDTLPHLPVSRNSASARSSSGPEEMRKAVRTFLKYGVDTIKLNLSGDNFVPHRRRPDHLDERRGSRHGGARDQAARQARHRACALLRLDQAGAAPRRASVHLSRELHRRGERSTCWRRRSTASSSRPAFRPRQAAP